MVVLATKIRHKKSTENSGDEEIAINNQGKILSIFLIDDVEIFNRNDRSKGVPSKIIQNLASIKVSEGTPMWCLPQSL